MPARANPGTEKAVELRSAGQNNPGNSNERTRSKPKLNECGSILGSKRNFSVNSPQRCAFQIEVCPACRLDCHRTATYCPRIIAARAAQLMPR